MTFARRQSRTAVVAICLVLVGTLTGCGNRLSHDEIVAAGAPVVADTSTTPDLAATSGGAVAGSAPSAAGQPQVTTPGQATTADTPTGASTGDQDRDSTTTPGKATGAATAAAATRAQVAIGNIGTYSGLLGSFFGNIPKALQAWAAWTNAHGGLNGHPVRVVSADDGADPSRDYSLAKQMIEKDKIIAFVNNYVAFGDAAINIDKLATAAHVPVIGPDEVNATNFTSPNVFPTGIYYGDAAGVVVREMVARGATKLGMLYCAEVPKLCGQIASRIKELNPKTVVYEAPASITAPSYTSQCLSMKNAGVNGLVLLLDGASDARLLRDCKLVGADIKATQGFGVVFSPSDTKNPELEGVIMASLTSPSDVKGVVALADYQAAMAKYAPGLPLDSNSSHVWAGGLVLQAAAKNLGADYRWQDLYAGLWAIKKSTFGGMTVPITYNQGKPPTLANCTFLVTIAGGKLTAPNGSKQYCL